jgi:membrane protein DedA with SNARE-associated domain
MLIWRVGGALTGAFAGLFIAKEFTESIFVVLPAAMVGSMLGIVLSFVFTKRRTAG